MPPLLSMVVPTRNRDRFLARLIPQVIESVINCGAAADVEFVCADNFSTDRTPQLVAQYECEYPWLRYAKQNEPAKSAEQSMSQAVACARGTYVWTLGDDDEIYPDSVGKVLEEIRSSGASLILLGMTIKAPDCKDDIRYYAPSSCRLLYPSATEFFLDFGFATATTTISCLCFKRDLFVVVNWMQLHRLSPIYSHSVGLFMAFAGHSVSVMRDPVVRYYMSTATAELESIRAVEHAESRPKGASFSIGLLSLLKCAEEHTGEPVHRLLQAREIELSKATHCVCPISTGLFVLNFISKHLTDYIEKGAVHNVRFSPEECNLVDACFTQTPLHSVARSLVALLTEAYDASDVRRVVMKPVWMRRIAGILEKATSTDQQSLSAGSHSLQNELLFCEGATPVLWTRAQNKECINQYPRPLITIVIPTYNRASQLRRLLVSLWRRRLHEDPFFEILCVDNASTDSTPAVLRRASERMPSLRVFRQPEHLGSAEENIKASVPRAHGQYIWMLSDDDELIGDNYLQMAAAIRNYSDVDFFLCNSSLETENGNNLIYARHACHQCRVEELILKYGFTTACARISMTVVRASAFPRMDEMNGELSIYSHVASYTSALSGRNAAFLNIPIVRYRAGVDVLKALYLYRETVVQFLRQIVIAIQASDVNALFSPEEEKEISNYVANAKDCSFVIRRVIALNASVRKKLRMRGGNQHERFSSRLSGPVRIPSVLASETAELDCLFDYLMNGSRWTRVRLLRVRLRRAIHDCLGRLGRRYCAWLGRN